MEKSFTKNRIFYMWGILVACLLFAGCTPPEIDTKVQSVTTNYVSDITNSGVTFSGTVSTDDYDNVTCGIIYGTLPSLSDKNGKKVETTSNGYFSLNVSGLKSNTTYYYRAYAVDNEFYTYGDEYSFDTNEGIYVTTNYATSITDSEAYIYGTVYNSNYNYVTCGIIYGTSSSLSATEGTMVSTSAYGEYYVYLYGLDANTTYYYRAYAIVDDEYVYGETYSFSTEQGSATVTSGDVIDLGLSVKWASCNVGASYPEGYGYYYAWGETDTKYEYSWSSYDWCYNSNSYNLTKYCSNSIYSYYSTVDNKTTLDLEDDAAYSYKGDGWRMPTSEEFNELLYWCTWEWTSLNGVYGYKVTGPNGNSIFLPAAGYRSDWSTYSTGSLGYYYTSSLNTSNNPTAHNLFFNQYESFMTYESRCYGFSVRAVKDENYNNDNSDNGTYTVNGVTFTMIPVEGGTFTMGATNEQIADANSNESPAHTVILSDYWIGETEVTQELWQAVMGSNPSFHTGDLQYPVENVSWNECQEFISTLNELTGETFRLPTEAEWEYAARGGNQSYGYKYSGSNYCSDVAWYWSNTSSSQCVKTKEPNELGIYDMSGNVWEWCSDRYDVYYSYTQTNPTGPSSGSYRVFRGGSWDVDSQHCRVSYRNFYSTDNGLIFIGLRLVR